MPKGRIVERCDVTNVLSTDSKSLKPAKNYLKLIIYRHMKQTTIQMLFNLILNKNKEICYDTTRKYSSWYKKTNLLMGNQSEMIEKSLYP